MLLGSDIWFFIFCTTGIFGPSPTLWKFEERERERETNFERKISKDYAKILKLLCSNLSLWHPMTS